MLTDYISFYHLSVCLSACLSTCLSLSLSLSIYLSICICVCVIWYMHTHLYICTQINTHIQRLEEDVECPTLTIFPVFSLNGVTDSTGLFIWADLMTSDTQWFSSLNISQCGYYLIWNDFFPQVLKIELRFSFFSNKHIYTLSHLSSPSFWSFILFHY